MDGLLDPSTTQELFLNFYCCTHMCTHIYIYICIYKCHLRSLFSIAYMHICLVLTTSWELHLWSRLILHLPSFNSHLLLACGSSSRGGALRDSLNSCWPANCCCYFARLLQMTIFCDVLAIAFLMYIEDTILNQMSCSLALTIFSAPFCDIT